MNYRPPDPQSPALTTQPLGCPKKSVQMALNKFLVIKAIIFCISQNYLLFMLLQLSNENM